MTLDLARAPNGDAILSVLAQLVLEALSTTHWIGRRQRRRCSLTSCSRWLAWMRAPCEPKSGRASCPDTTVSPSEIFGRTFAGRLRRNPLRSTGTGSLYRSTHHGGQGGGCAGPPEAYTAHVDEAVLDDPVLPVLAAGRLFSEPDRKSGLLSVTTRLDCGQLVLCAALKDYWANKMQARAPTMDAIATITRQSNRATKPMSSPYAAEVLLYTGATRKLTGLSSIV